MNERTQRRLARLEAATTPLDTPGELRIVVEHAHYPSAEALREDTRRRAEAPGPHSTDVLALRVVHVGPTAVPPADVQPPGDVGYM